MNCCIEDAAPCLCLWRRHDSMLTFAGNFIYKNGMIIKIFGNICNLTKHLCSLPVIMIQFEMH